MSLSICRFSILRGSVCDRNNLQNIECPHISELAFLNIQGLWELVQWTFTFFNAIALAGRRSPTQTHLTASQEL
ncbi:MAG: hypothetical protein F6K16_30200 [Symploca sp. SIO2B6]|nr:hypothetical protein [Symploca sp. SIO2B6]